MDEGRGNLQKGDEKMIADVAEIFESIQGEGILVGVGQIFIRFARCNLSCSKQKLSGIS